MILEVAVPDNYELLSKEDKNELLRMILTLSKNFVRSRLDIKHISQDQVPQKFYFGDSVEEQKAKALLNSLGSIKFDQAKSDEMMRWVNEQLS